MPNQSVVVIGGGVVGLATAFHLRHRGAEVTVLEADHVGAGASWGNAGWLVPVLSAPLPGPGMIRAAVRSLLDADGAFYLAPSQVLRLAPWLARFARASSRRRYLEGLRATARLAERAVDAAWTGALARQLGTPIPLQACTNGNRARNPSHGRACGP